MTDFLIKTSFAAEDAGYQMSQMEKSTPVERSDS